MAANDIETFFNRLTESNSSNQFIKLTLSSRRNKKAELINVFIKPVQLKSGLKWCFVSRYPTKDITKNYDAHEAIILIKSLLQTDFFKADLFTTTNDYQLTINKNGGTFLVTKKATHSAVATQTHDKEKKRQIDAKQNTYLHELGVTTIDGKVKSDMNDKYRQINKYIEIVDGVVKSAELPDNFRVVDMGAGKGYLTFALYDYLVNTSKLHPQITGVELRKNLVDDSNAIAANSGFENLKFKEGSIETTEIPQADMLIALHACDTATDEAIFRGIKNDSRIIICAPCCHKQIRKQLHPVNDLKPISDYGILEERQAEILTDTIRALILRAFGYKTKVFEFISTEHTAKNVMIVAVKSKVDSGTKEKMLDEVKRLKTLFGIEYHHLEKLMGV